jgi:hypothetical protein
MVGGHGLPSPVAVPSLATIRIAAANDIPTSLP